MGHPIFLVGVRTIHSVVSINLNNEFNLHRNVTRELVSPNSRTGGNPLLSKQLFQ